MVADVIELRAESARDSTVSQLSKKAKKYPAKPTANYIAQESQEARKGIKVSLIKIFLFSTSINLSAIALQRSSMSAQVSLPLPGVASSAKVQMHNLQPQN